MSKKNRYIVFDIEDNLPEHISDHVTKKDARSAFETHLVNRGLSRKDISESLKTDIYMSSDVTIHLVDLG